ncbi:hypothetical protein LNP00_00655 [Fructobacillus sp. M158]|uniref:hypothetical protein n=1 Tax=Fructobacillus parabroussonetiae TaxID=2713174 RepID=UPI00200AB2F4|nr:hypothetical protein [Fructobacillus parabroussonetiae]MCK8616882.1 hypothetical protein [Fructobacillus parabroussonetiae]
MTEIEQLREKGLQALEDGDFQLAADALCKVYQSDRTFENNQLFAGALSKNGQADSALTIAKEYVGEYMGQKKDYEFYFDLCLDASYFIMARRMAVESIEDADKERRIQTIEEAEDVARAERGDWIADTAWRFRHIAAYDALTQQQVYQDALSLPVDEFSEGACQALIDPDCLALIRVSLMTDIQCLFLHRVVDYLYLDGKRYQTVLCDHPKPVRDPVYSAARDYLNQMVGQEDPVAYQMLLDQLHLEMNVLFPQIDRVTDPVAWVQADLALLNGQRFEGELPESDEQAAIHQRVHQFLAEQGAA